MSAYQKEVKDILGKDMFRKLRTIVAEGKISQSQTETFAYELDSRVGGKFKNRSCTSGFEYNANAFMAILGDFYEIATEQKRENLSAEIIRILKEDLELIAVALELEKAKQGSASMEVKQGLAKEPQRKRKGEDLGLVQNLPKKRREEITSTYFHFNGERTVPAPGTKPVSSDQGTEPICTYHAIAKCIQQKLHDYHIDADHDKIVDSLLKLFGDDRKCRRFPEELHNTTIRVIERSDKTRRPTGRRFDVTLGVNNEATSNVPWPTIVPEVQKDLRTSSVDILAIGLLQLTPGDPKSNHAVYIESYNARTHEVHTINSWGAQGELGPRKDGVLKEEDFYAVCFVGLSAYMETEEIMDVEYAPC